MTTGLPVDDPELIAAPPPAIRRDRMVQVWVLALAVSWLGDALWTVALAWTAASRLPAGLAGVVLGIETLPQALLVILGGVIADRFDTRRVLIAGQLGQAVVLGAGALAWTSGARGAPTLIAIAVGFGVASGLTLPAGMTLARQLVRGDDLGTVSGWNQIANRTARLVGAPLGGVIVAVGGPVPAMLLDAATFVAVAIVLAVWVRPRFRLERQRVESWAVSLTDGLAYLRRTPSVRLLVLALCSLNVFVSPVVALGVSLRVSHSGWGAQWVGIADAALAVGAILGSLAAIRRRALAPARAGLIGLVVQGAAVACVCIGLRPVLVAALFTVGVTAGIASVWLSGVFQRTIATAYLGRVSSVSSLGDLAFLPLAIPAFGWLAGSAGLPAATIAFGGSMSLLSAWFAGRRRLAELR